MASADSTAERHTLLIIDDDDQVRTYCRRCLICGGFEVLEADNGFDALLMAAERGGSIDMLITDIEMPQIRGPEIALAFQTLWPETKTLLISGANDGSPLNLDSSVLFLAKPFTPQKLLKTVGAALATPADTPAVRTA